VEQFQKMRTTTGKMITYKGIGKGSREREGFDWDAYRNSTLWDKMGPTKEARSGSDTSTDEDDTE